MFRLNLLLKGFLFIATFVLIFVLFIDYDIPSSEIIQEKIKEVLFSNESIISKHNIATTTESKIFLDSCDLADIDPWDPTILRYLNPQADSTKTCKPTVKPLSKIENGRLFVNPQRADAMCQYQCLLPKDDYNLEFGKWIDIENGTKPECDIVKVECRGNNENGTIGTFYKFMHAHIYRPDAPKYKKPPSEKPDVYLIVFDSVSESNFIRSMPKTQHVIREYYESISFRHVNKVGLNSRPNGFAMLMGKQVYPIAKSPVSRGHEADYNDTHTYCKHYLDGDQFIGDRFQDDGYVTMMSEDWAMGVFNWPNCKGYSKKPVDHYMRPFQLHYEGNKRTKDSSINGIIHQGSCRETFYYQMEYLQNFIDTYSDKPKYSITWMINLAHNGVNTLYHTDDFFYRFFKNNKEKFKNSYILFMGDHGLRFTGIRNTAIGELEDNNPFLFMSIPETLRRNTTLTETLKQNAKELLTHYDIYATLAEITQPLKPRIPKPLIKGSSLFHPLPQPRTCDRLQIPFEYCICKSKKKRLPKKNEIETAATELIISRMNENLKESNETAGCVPLMLDTKAGITVDEFEENGEIKVYQVTYTTLPGKGQFWGFIVQKENGGSLEIISEKFPRLNAYAAQAGCASKAKYASYCFCKNLLTTTMMPTGTKKS